MGAVNFVESEAVSSIVALVLVEGEISNPAPAGNSVKSEAKRS